MSPAAAGERSWPSILDTKARDQDSSAKLPILLNLR